MCCYFKGLGFTAFCYFKGLGFKVFCYLKGLGLRAFFEVRALFKGTFASAPGVGFRDLPGLLGGCSGLEAFAGFNFRIWGTS